MTPIKAFIHISLIIIFLGFSACSSKNTTLSQEEIHQHIQLAIDEANIIASGGEPFKAIEQLDKLLDKYPSNTKVLEAMAFTYLDAKDPGLAAFYFEQILLQEPDSQEYRIFAAQAYTDADEHNDAIRNYKLYLEHFPDDKATWLALTANFESNKNYAEAVDAFLKAHKLSNSEPSSKACVKIAQLYQKERNLDEMKNWLYQAVQKDPKNQDALKTLLKIEVGGHNYPLAEKHLKALESQKINPVDAHFISSSREKINKWRAEKAKEEALAIAKEQAKQAKMAKEAAAKKALEEEDLFADNLSSEAIETVEAHPAETFDDDDLFSEQDEAVAQEVPEKPKPMPVAKVTPKPIKQTKEIKKAQPKQPGHFEYAKKAIATDNYPKAIKHYWDAVMEKPETPEYWHELSKALSKTGDYQNAEMTMLEAMRRKPNNLGYQIDYLNLFKKQGDHNRWLSELKKAKQKFPNSPDLLFALGKAYEHLEQNNSLAKQTYEHFIQVAPNHPKANSAKQRLASL